MLRIISGCKCAVSGREICQKVEKSEIRVECTDQNRINNLPLQQQFALKAIKLQMFGRQTRHFWHPIITCFFLVSCPCLTVDATDSTI